MRDVAIVTCACIPGTGEFAARLCPGPTDGAYRVGYGAGDGTDEPCDCACHREEAPQLTPPREPA
jgi:hypothetical protein